MTSGYSPEEMRRYWRVHSRLWRDLDRKEDPEGLTNVCYNGAPLWLNRFAAHCQRMTFRRLLRDVGPVDGKRVLDVGCGSGRWSRLVTSLGGRVTGIDLQPETLRDNKIRYPSCRFVEMGAESLGLASGSFDMAMSVTVLQHIPVEIQDEALAEIRRVLVDGGIFVSLEGIRDRGPHVFCHSVEGWIRRASAAGFRAERVLGYDYAPLIHILREAAGRYRRGVAGNGLIPVEEYVTRFRKGLGAAGAARRVYRTALHAATLASYPLESLLVRLAPGSWAHHVGLLLRAV